MTATRQPPGRRAFLGMTVAALAMPGLARGAVPALDGIEGRAFATGWRVLVPAGTRLARAGREIEVLLAGIDRRMSPWREDSEITRVNRGRAGHHAVSPDTEAVSAAALRLSRASAGAFDPTVGPLVARWGFGPIVGPPVGDWRDLRVGDGAIMKAREGVTVDLCGIAKGWALDRMAGVLADAGCSSALIDLGGELRAIGEHPAGRPWHVAVDDPDGQGEAAALLALSGRAVATSGLTWQGYSLHGRDYGHIVDPHAGRPAAGALRSVTVLAGDAMTADGWATALFAAGEARGPALARRLGLSALFLLEGPDGLRREAVGDMAGRLL